VPITLAAADGRVTLVEERRQSLLFISIAATSLISAFFASSLIQRQLDANRRLVLCGYQAAELIAARLTVLLGIIATTALYTWLVLGFFSSPRFPGGVLLGLTVGAFVYGCYGLLVGTLFRRELESIFAILVLVNIDAGWLQNPLYYHNAGSKWLIEALPAHFPSQVAYQSAFTSDRVGALVAYALAYGAAFLLVALALYVRRMRMTR
ncbi:MAG: hypothetical protein ABJB33_10790, partial [Gemmatimonadota bacterium]